MRAAILRPRSFIVSGIEWALLTVADGADAIRIDAEGDDVFLRGVRAPIAEGKVVLLGAALVTVALDQHVVLRILFEPRCRRGERGLRVRCQRRFVVCIERVLQVSALL